MPWAIFAMVLAVAGAMTYASAHIPGQHDYSSRRSLHYKNRPKQDFLKEWPG